MTANLDNAVFYAYVLILIFPITSFVRVYRVGRNTTLIGVPASLHAEVYF